MTIKLEKVEIREESLRRDCVTYTLPQGLSILATARGVTFRGSSITFDTDEDLARVKSLITKASKISHELAAGLGIPSEEELDGELKLRYRYVEKDKLWLAWFEHYASEREINHSLRAAVHELRYKWNQNHGNIHNEQSS